MLIESTPVDCKCGALTTGPPEKSLKDILKYFYSMTLCVTLNLHTKEVFRNLDAQYEMARSQTHTQRGMGLGFTSSMRGMDTV